MLVKTEDMLNPFTSAMLIGPPKSGKTRSLFSLYLYCLEQWHKRGKSGPRQLHHFDLDGTGASTLIHLFQARGTAQDDPLVAKYKRFNGSIEDLKIYRYKVPGGRKISATDSPEHPNTFVPFIDEFNKFYDQLDPRTGFWREPEQSPAIIAIDSGTALEDIICDFICKTRRREINGSGTDDNSRQARFADWGAMKDKEEEVIEAARSLPAHFVYCVHDELRQEIIAGKPAEKGNSPETAIPAIGTNMLYNMPSLIGGLRETMPKRFDIVLYTKTIVQNSKCVYKWITRPVSHPTDGNIRGAGIRSAENLPQEVIQDFAEILL